MKKQFVKCPKCGKVQIDDYAHPKMFLCINIECNNVCRRYTLEPLKALSVKQPWAWLIVNGYKDLENRKTLKHLKGTFLIHAGVKIDDECVYWLDRNKKKFPLDTICDISHFIPKRDKLEAGGIVGYVEFNGSVQESDSPWFAGPNGLVITKAHTLPFTVCKGQQGVFYPEID